MKNRKRAIATTAALLGIAAVLVGLYLAATPDATWQFVVDAEARTVDGEVVATRQAVADECRPNGEGACLIEWDWEGETLPVNAREWVKPYGLSHGETVPVAFIPDWCPVELELCQAKVIHDGEVSVVEPSAECLSALAQTCSLEPDERGFWYAGTLPSEGYYAFYEPLLAEWYDVCPVNLPTSTPAPPAPTYTPGPTYTPDPMPTCRPTWTPLPTDTPYPSSTPYPTPTEWPTQPPW